MDLKYRLDFQEKSIDSINRKRRELEDHIEQLIKEQSQLQKDLAMVLDHLKLEIKDIPAKRIITEK